MHIEELEFIVNCDTIDITQHGDLPLELGDVVNIKQNHHNKSPILHPPNFLDAVHIDIGYGDCKLIGGARYVLMLVIRATRFAWSYALKTLTHKEIIMCASTICG